MLRCLETRICQHTFSSSRRMTSDTWEAQAQVARHVLEKSIQKQWLLPAEKLPSPDRLNVIDVPRECGLLSNAEIDMTETDATGLVEKMRQGFWTAEAVLTAFLKRATIGHQLVSYAVWCSRRPAMLHDPLLIVYSSTLPLSLWQKMLFSKPAHWTTTFVRRAALLDHYMACQFR